MSEKPDTPQLGVAIWMVNLINGIFSFVQEFRAGKEQQILGKNFFPVGGKQ